MDEKNIVTAVKCQEMKTVVVVHGKANDDRPTPFSPGYLLRGRMDVQEDF